MKIKAGQEKNYAKFRETNSSDPYSYAIVRYMDKWAELMEEEISNGKSVVEIADATSRAADTEGITGFMYGAAVASLAEFWEHGEELRKWHNKEYDYDGEGTVNPAILTI